MTTRENVSFQVALAALAITGVAILAFGLVATLGFPYALLGAAGAPRRGGDASGQSVDRIAVELK